MDDDQSSNDVVLVEIEPNGGARRKDGPIIELFKSLITNDNKQNTVLTNAQLVDILQKEFNIDIRKIHELEVEIYLNVVKKYLKDWPEWDEFEQTIVDLKSENNYDAVARILNEKYTNLKKYLSNMLEIAKFYAPSVIKKLPEKGEVTVMKKTEKEDVVMEVQATRIQLNHLIYRHPLHNNKIFNVNDPIPGMYDYQHVLALESILNWWGINIEIKMKWQKLGTLLLKYENQHKLQHTLVNKKLLRKCQTSELNQLWQVKFRRKFTTEVSKEDIFKCFDICGSSEKLGPVLVVMRKFFSNVIQSMPRKIGIPADFRRYLNGHSYVRYLYEDVSDELAENADKYDLQLEEVISPMCQLYIGNAPTQDQEDSVKIHCSLCKLTLTGENVLSKLKNHFKYCHNFEPDWQCTKCHKTIPTDGLTQANWRHACFPSDNMLYKIFSR